MYRLYIQLLLLDVMSGCKIVVTVDGLEAKVKKAMSKKIKRVNFVTLTSHVPSGLFKTKEVESFSPNIHIYTVEKPL